LGSARLVAGADSVQSQTGSRLGHQGNESGTPPSAKRWRRLVRQSGGHGLPLLEMIARARSQEIRLPGSPDATLRVQVACLELTAAA
jgi:hypothetical protein